MIAGGDAHLMSVLFPSLSECHQLGVHTQQQALDHLSSRVGPFFILSSLLLHFAVLQVKGSRSNFTRAFKQSKSDDAREALATLIISHIPGNQSPPLIHHDLTPFSSPLLPFLPFLPLVIRFDFSHKSIYLCHMVRRMLLAAEDESSIDDKVRPLPIPPLLTSLRLAHVGLLRQQASRIGWSINGSPI